MKSPLNFFESWRRRAAFWAPTRPSPSLGKARERKLSYAKSHDGWREGRERMKDGGELLSLSLSLSLSHEKASLAFPNLFMCIPQAKQPSASSILTKKDWIRAVICPTFICRRSVVISGRSPCAVETRFVRCSSQDRH